MGPKWTLKNCTKSNNQSTNMKKTIYVLLFNGFEMLDVFGPLEMFTLINSMNQAKTIDASCAVRTIAKEKSASSSNGGPKVLCDLNLDEALREAKGNSSMELFIPGGIGTRVLAKDKQVIDFIVEFSYLKPKRIFTVCTGAGILAATGLLEGLHATTNKRAFEWPVSVNNKVKWQKKARWVVDTKLGIEYATSSGVSAGMDMAMDMIRRDYGLEVAKVVASMAEYRWDPNQRSDDDPFAKL